MIDKSKRSFLLNSTAALGAAVLFPDLGKATNVVNQHTVEIRNFEYAPKELMVKEGDSITWINRDIAPHTATADDDSWDTKELALGESMTIPITKGMVSDYFCVFHPHMKAHFTIISS